jgi:hypothetical protein
MTINELIYSMYSGLSDNIDSCIETDFALKHENNIIAIGKTAIKKYSDTIELKGNIKDINFSKFTGDKGDDKNIIHINANDFPKYFSCELMNFPTKNRKDDFVDKKITISFLRVRLNSNLSFSLYYDYSSFSFDMQPLYETDTNKMCDIICQ